ncbi:MAG: hypothetical protein DMG22_21180 [Acidobacteria bacterium]|nr:MAG: hypothetical protein DMG22_21180 [Acidobacteriota bacterium]
MELERYIVSPLRVETIVEEDGGKQTEVEGEAEIEMVKDLTGAEVSFVGIGTSEIELPDELPSVVGLPEQVLHIDHAAFQMALDALGE